MASFGTVFDANSVAPKEAFAILPPGKYRAEITDSDMKPTRNGNGQYLWLELTILDGEEKGRKVFDRLNLVNANTQTAEIAQRQLSAICHAIGKLSVSDSEELHHRAMTITVRVRPGREVVDQQTGARTAYDASNEIRGYEPAQGAQPFARTSAPSAAQAPASTPAANSAPWKRKTG
jgi:hypothetical protein